MKQCEICGRTLPDEDFSKSYKKRCKRCVAEMKRKKRGQIIQHIDSIQEEPKGKGFFDGVDFLPVGEKQEPVSEELEEEINNYIKDNFFGSGSMGFLSNRTKGELDSVDVTNIARHFAEWQKNKDLEDSLKSDMTMPNKFYEKGKEDMKQQMMKDAILGIIEERADGLLGWDTVYGTDKDYRNYLLSHFKNGDKVKLVIIKEE